MALGPRLGTWFGIAGAPFDVYRLARERGVLVRPLATAIAVSPPLTATPAHLGLIADALGGGARRHVGPPSPP